MLRVWLSDYTQIKLYRCLLIYVMDSMCTKLNRMEMMFWSDIPPYMKSVVPEAGINGRDE